MLNAFFVATAVILAERLDATSLVSLILAGQMIKPIISLLLAPYGSSGYSAHPVSTWSVIGVILIASGVIIIRRF
ncbi:MAG: DMT family transporter [Desulfobacterales bacterium]|nr:DMT family transporter [Desulfobacterales bacterium]MDD4072359.1 DMT family transporter [Desulfobacterales bacterium]MDD4393031.1 DMT family transporter [Desulfobacterales bacterium]